MDLTVNCLPMNARLTERGCMMNRAKVEIALEIREEAGPGTLLRMRPEYMNCLESCTQCERMDQGFKDKYAIFLTEDVEVLRQEVERKADNWDRFDPQAQHEKRQASWRKYNASKKGSKRTKKGSDLQTKRRKKTYVECSICGEKHPRRPGWGHLHHPVCEKCDNKIN